MNLQIWMFFALITNSAIGVCQLSEDFSSESAFQSDLFMGDKEDFEVSQGVLALNTENGGSSILYAPIFLSDTTEFSIWITLDFAPSAQNRLTYYLWSADGGDLGQSDALFIQIGESGSSDNIELYSRKDGVEVLLGEGELSRLGQDPAVVRLRAVWAKDFIQIEADYNGGTDYVTEIETIVDQPTNLNGHTAIQCDYTSSRSDRFYFDDLYVGPVRRDTTPPIVTKIMVEEDRVLLSFSEAIAPSSFDRDRYLVTPNRTIERVEPINAMEVTLYFDDPLLASTIYQLQLTDVFDMSGNSLDTILSLELILKPIDGDLLINEILFNPEGDGADFVEIINVTDTKVSLEGLILSNNDRGEEVPIMNPKVIFPGQILAFTDHKLDLIDRYPSHDTSVIFEQSIPRFNNDDGNVTLSYQDKILDSFDYTEDYHDVLLDDVNGVSLERRSVLNETDDAATWTSALASVNYATPGVDNSVSSAGIESGRLTIELGAKHFSPNGDRVEDELVINYSIQDVYYANIRIFNDQGIQVKDFMKNERVVGNGTWIWDGRSEDGYISPIGIYVIWIELYNIQGDRQVKKLTTVLADYLD